MMHKLLTVIMLLWALSSAAAGTDVLIEVNTGRQDGLFTKSPVYQRAILSQPDVKTDTVMLFFRGYPGVARIMSVEDKKRNLIPFLRMNEQIILNSGIALVVMDCPTDEWGTGGFHPTACLDSYRSSRKHAEDVRHIIERLRSEFNFKRIFIMGHSMGSISSRWLAKHLGTEITGSIHSASMNSPNKNGMGSSMPGFDYSLIQATSLHIHHANDACPGTPYSTVTGYAGDNLISVYGGSPEGDVCEGKHFHSYRGREQVVVQALIEWIKTGGIAPRVGE